MRGIRDAIDRYLDLSGTGLLGGQTSRFDNGLDGDNRA